MCRLQRETLQEVEGSKRCIQPSICHCHSLSLAPVNPDWFYPSWFYLSGTCSPGQSHTNSRRAVKRLCVCVLFHLRSTLQISMYEDKMTRLKQHQKRLQELSTQNETEVKAQSYLHNQSTITLFLHFCTLCAQSVLSTSFGFSRLARSTERKLLGISKATNKTFNNT